LKIISRITVDKNIIEYNKNEKLIKALPGFKVHLGFGLHIGWSIEGAIGSRFKIDMSYLSPHVNMSSRLEGLTKDYKKPLLFTNSVYNLINSTKIRNLCRKIDVV
jgi:class 3 adenylate cyclase